VDPYCSASALTGVTDGDLKLFFQQLEAGNERVLAVWQEYLSHLAVAVANLRMLFDCDIIIGGYVGSFMDAHIDQLRELVLQLSTFDDNADYVRPCQCKTEAIAAGSALKYISVFLNSI
jgi:predicted NBD/HSP70 family sugar kinase